MYKYIIINNQAQEIIPSVDYKVDQFQQNWIGPERSWCFLKKDKHYPDKQIWNLILQWLEKGFLLSL